MPTHPNIILLARLGRPHGLKGWIRFHSFTDPPENILNYPHLFIKTNHHWDQFQIETHDFHGSYHLVKIQNCDTPEQAREYTNCDIGVERDQLPTLSEGEYYWSDLEGLKVINQEGVVLGHIDHLFETGANDVIVVKEEEKEYLIPYIKNIVLHIDLKDKKILVDWDPEF